VQHGGLAVVVLAAGASSRFGSPKQLARLRDATLLHTVVARATDVAAGNVTVVLGAHAEAIRPHIAGMPISVIVNRRWQEGLASSLRAGIESLPDDVAALIWLGDQVGVTAEDLRRLIAAWDGDRSRIAASSYGGTIGVPAIFPRSVFPELLALRGDRGAKGVLRHHPEKTTFVDMPNAATDIDTPTDLENSTGSRD
jgi:molybdenum cofactor cytidylyltransferase